MCKIYIPLISNGACGVSHSLSMRFESINRADDAFYIHREANLPEDGIHRLVRPIKSQRNCLWADTKKVAIWETMYGSVLRTPYRLSPSDVVNIAIKFESQQKGLSSP